MVETLLPEIRVCWRNDKLWWLSRRFHPLIWRAKDMVQYLEFPGLSRRVDSTVCLFNRPFACYLLFFYVSVTVKLTKPWTPEIFMECYCIVRNKPIRHKITKLQTATVISLFWGLLAYPELYCDWPVHNQHSWNFSGVYGFLSLTVIALQGSFFCFLYFVVCSGKRGLEVNNSNVHKRIIIIVQVTWKSL